MILTDIAYLVLCRIGFQNDGGGQHHAVIAETPHGRIPGKAKNGTCWYAPCRKRAHNKRISLGKDIFLR